MAIPMIDGSFSYVDRQLTFSLVDGSWIRYYDDDKQEIVKMPWIHLPCALRFGDRVVRFDLTDSGVAAIQQASAMTSYYHEDAMRQIAALLGESDEPTKLTFDVAVV